MHDDPSRVLPFRRGGGVSTRRIRRGYSTYPASDAAAIRHVTALSRLYNSGGLAAALQVLSGLTPEPPSGGDIVDTRISVRTHQTVSLLSSKSVAYSRSYCVNAQAYTT